jgi:hypothetical protein
MNSVGRHREDGRAKKASRPCDFLWRPAGLLGGAFRFVVLYPKKGRRLETLAVNESLLCFFAGPFASLEGDPRAIARQAVSGGASSLRFASRLT